MLENAIVAAYANHWEEALDLLLAAAESGDNSAQAQLSILADGAGHDWKGLRASVDPNALVSPKSLTRLSTMAMIGVSKAYASKGMCDWLIQHATGRLEPALTNVSETGEQRQHPDRTATNCAFGPEHRDMILAVLQARAARLASIPLENHEAPNVISYLPGQQFALHVDFIDPGTPGFQHELQVLGQRVITIITYLNDDFEGATTHFPALALDFRGSPGDALAFSNVLPDGTPDRNTVHAGKPPASGRKWVLSQWLRSQPQPN